MNIENFDDFLQLVRGEVKILFGQADWRYEEMS
jgi:hypothetical protein